MMRQIGKQILTIVAWFGVAMAAHAEMIVTDPLSGVAVDGYDVVSYFTGPEPELGKPQHEYVWQGVPWYFASAANRDIFMRNPDVYAPQFGGHCAMSLSRGYLSDGRPALYVVEALKLYLFYSTANREAFLMSRRAAIRDAEARWPALSKELAGPAAASVAPEAAPVHVHTN